VMGHLLPQGKGKEPLATYWVVFQVEATQQIRLLPEADQIRFYERVKAFLDGLSSTITFLSLVENSDPESDPAIVAQRQAETLLSAHPRLQHLQQAALASQREQLQHCTKTQHSVLVSATSQEVLTARQEAVSHSLLHTLFALLLKSRQ